MTPGKYSPGFCKSRRLIFLTLFVLASALTCLADSYANAGTILISGTITSIENQQTCDVYGCQIGSTWNLEIDFFAPEWNAPWSNYEFSTVLLNCIGGPPCFTGYSASSDFGWGPYMYDILYAKIVNGSLVDVRDGCGGYYIEWGEKDVWSRVDAFSGTTTGFVVPTEYTPEPVTIVVAATGAAIGYARLRFSRIGRFM